MRTVVLAALLAAAALTAPAAADIIPAGHRPVDHVMVLLEDERLDDVQLHLAPVRGFGGTEAWVPGEEAGWSGKYGTRVYALRTGESAPDDPGQLAEAAFASGDIPFGNMSFVPTADPTRRIVTTVRLVSIADGTIALEEVGTRRYDGDGEELTDAAGPGTVIPVLIGLAVVGVVLVLVLLGRRRRPGA